MNSRRYHGKRKKHHNQRKSGWDTVLPPTHPIPLLPLVYPEPSPNYPIPDSIDIEGYYTGPTTYIRPFKGQAYDPDFPGMDIYGTMTLADIAFVGRLSQTLPDGLPKGIFAAPPRDIGDRSSSLRIEVKEKYYPVVIFRCSGACHSSYDSFKLKQQMERVWYRHKCNPYDCVMDIRDLKYCDHNTIYFFFSMMGSLGPMGIPAAIQLLTRITIISNDTTTTGIGLTIHSARTTTIPRRSELTRIPFRLVESNKEADRFRNTTKPYLFHLNKNRKQRKKETEEEEDEEEATYSDASA